MMPRYDSTAARLLERVHNELIVEQLGLVGILRRAQALAILIEIRVRHCVGMILTNRASTLAAK